MVADASVAAVFEPVQTPTTFEGTVERLGTAIRLGILAPGSRLPSERDLADQLAISRSTLRQAINALVESGHLVSVRGRAGGTFVVPEPPLASGEAGPLREDWHEVLDLRTAIEVGTVTLAAERIEQESLRVLRESVARMDTAIEFDEYRRADIRFHITIAQATGVPRLVALVTAIQAEVSELVAHIAHPLQVLRHSNADHARLTQALARHDVARAVRVVRLHLEGTEQIIGGLRLADAPPRTAAPQPRGRRSGDSPRFTV
jgi:GntR family transcriptional regulator, transcriptional repressor for pyruvate dehydrogenase complex